MDNQSKNIHLILGSGGARGLAHIGVIRHLENQGFNITQITGCSMGALIGGIYAAGKLNEYENWIKSINRFDVLRFLDLSLTGKNGLVKGDKIMDQLREWIGDIQIENLSIPFTAVSTDILSQKEIWIHQGDLIDAIRASISVPGIFTPLVKNDMVLVDGGILNPLPIPPQSLLNKQISIAVSLSGRPIKKPLGQIETIAGHSDGSLTQQKSAVTRFIDTLQEFFQSEHTESEQRTKTDLSLTDILMGMFDTMQDTLARYQIAGNPPDILIEIPSNICESHDFHRGKELIPAGTYWAKKALDEQLSYLESTDR
ncbi:patatin-like phospholipase family protein [Thiomicrorhabdus sp. 6S2-11]|uniref:Patatin-like phospholipase family protein n=1 Tax=Thiomicrorhabdus marina TaxID=2818442 RepID=A0ABS3Q2F3_9GAMM|nr:patatin-like phospholipase family protein [Thiomicrorhabdus marina]MBO1926516.1 patatin-like phospholipase family protein [Thiomicrorhabdus marina]